MGLLAVAYILRGMRPDRYASRPASTACFMANAICTGLRGEGYDAAVARTGEDGCLQFEAELFDLVVRGVLTFPVSHTYALADAARAHRDIEQRKSAGSMLLVP